MATKPAPKKKFKFSFEINQEKCMSCAACEWECHRGGGSGAIYVDDQARYAIDQEICNRCGRCSRACPADAIIRVTAA